MHSLHHLVWIGLSFLVSIYPLASHEFLKSPTQKWADLADMNHSPNQERSIKSLSRDSRESPPNFGYCWASPDGTTIQCSLGGSRLTGNSPEAPLAKSDTVFVQDVGGGLDTYVYRDQLAGGQLLFPITIDRYFSTFIDATTVDSDGFLLPAVVQRLVSAHLLPAQATLSLEVFDVDSGASGCSEVDKVLVNGNVLTTSLSGLDGKWVRWQTTVPIEYLKFPTAPAASGHLQGIAQQISIDVDSTCQNSWAIQVDWAALQIDAPIRPILLLAGWGGNVASWVDFRQDFANDGIAVESVWQNTPNHASILAAAELIASQVQSFSDRNGVDKVNLVGHSKGGLDARRALYDTATAQRVERLISLGSPHHGNMWRRVLIGELWYCVIHPSPSEQPFDQDCIASAEALTMDHLREEMNFAGCRYLGSSLWSADYDSDGYFDPAKWTGCRPIYVQSPSVEYRTLAAQQDFVVGFRSPTYPWRANTIPYPTQPNVDVLYRGLGFGHTDLRSNLGVYQCIVSFIDERIYPRASCPSNAFPLAQTVDAGILEISTTSALIWPESEDQFLNQSTIATSIGNTTYTDIPLDVGVPAASDLALFTAYSPQPISLTLLSPSGQMITSDALDPSFGITVVRQIDTAEDGSTGWVYQFQSSQPESGVWRLATFAPVATRVGLVTTLRSSLNLRYRLSSLDGLALRPGTPMSLTVALVSGTTPLASAIMTGAIRSLDGSVVPLGLRDDGLGGDSVAQDGIFVANFVAPTVSSSNDSQYRWDITATAGHVQRMEYGGFTINPNSARLDLGITSDLLDADGDGLFNQLSFTIPVYITRTGHFGLRGTLFDVAGRAVATTAYSSRLAQAPMLQAGNRSITLTIEGQTIRAQGGNGPYRLGDLLLMDETAESLSVDFQATAGAVVNVNPDQLEGPLVELLTTQESAIDTNQNGLFDQLLITAVVKMTMPGPYLWSGRLLDSDNREVGWSYQERWLAGTQSIPFKFDGRAIGNGNHNGPYHLTDVSIVQVTGRSDAIRFDRLYTTQAYLAQQFERDTYKIYLPMVRR